MQSRAYVLTLTKKIIRKIRWSRSATGVDTSKSAKKFDLASLKSEIDKLDIDNRKSTDWFKQFEK